MKPIFNNQINSSFKEVRVIIFSIFSVLIMTSMAWATEYYVDVSKGNDSSLGTFSSPVRTISRGVALATAGDTINLMPGTYNGTNTISKSGTPEKYITIKSYATDPSGYAVIDGGGSFGDTGKNGFNISGSDWLKFENLKLRNCWRNGWSGTGNEYIWIRNCDIIGAGVLMTFDGNGSHHILVEECTWNKHKPIWDSIDWATAHDDYGNANGSLINNVSRGNRGNFVIRNNEIFYAYNPLRLEAQNVGDFGNIEIYGNNIHHCIDNAIEPEGNCFNIQVYHNVFNQIGGGILSLDNVNGGPFLFYGNVAYYDPNDEPGAPISWTRTRRVVKWTNAGGNYMDDAVKIYNNTFFYREFQESGTNNKNNYISHYNNIGVFWPSAGWKFNGLDQATNDFDYDCSYGYNPSTSLSFPSVYGWESHGIIQNPLVVNPAGGDFKLKTGSPCKDAGKIISGFTQAYDGSAPDIGAYEGNSLVEGPPFYILVPSNGLGYTEKPRITRHRVSGAKLTVFWSWALATSSVSANDIVLSANGTNVPINSIQLTGSGRELIVDTGTDLSGKTLSLSFNKLPVGTNGATATLWASTVGTISASTEPETSPLMPPANLRVN